ncbi:thyroid receptor-interacting protein 11-like [Aricia agestis]|uniref:thyroid receptor-interacting protein 11-like n=1 Tax=Aricia agestis TaxID=91739 RepID=UPI001C20B441|nr:thyroid receptor-interacting protein 11-like [Aricia agestis]
MSWLNLNQSLNSLKGQITNFATEVLNDGSGSAIAEEPSQSSPDVKILEDKCHTQELEIAALKRLTQELEASLQSERLARKNGVKEDETSWYWDPPPQASKPNSEVEAYKTQIQELQAKLSAVENQKPTGDDDEIARLREENQNLASSLEDLDSQHQMAMEKLLALKKELQKNFEVLKQEHEELKSANSEFASVIKELESKLAEKDDVIETMKASQFDYATLHHKYQNLERVHGLLKENAEKFQEENQELNEEVFKLQEQVANLEHELEIAGKPPDLTDMVPKEKYESVLKQLNDFKKRRDSNQMHLDEVNIDDNAKGVIETLKRDISMLKQRLAHQEGVNHDNDSKSISADKIVQLYNKYVNFELPVDTPQSDNDMIVKLESIFKAVRSYKQEMDDLQAKLFEKISSINNLQAQIDELTSENEYLTSDVQHLESDLEEMKKNNDFLISEIAALKSASKLEPIIETHEDNLAKLETELADCNKINKTFESEIRRIEKELSVVKNEKNILQDSLNDMRNKYKSMLDQLEMCKTESRALQDLENDEKLLKTTQVKKSTDEFDQLRRRLSIANSEKERLAIDNNIIENDKVILIGEINELKNALVASSNSHKELESMKIILDHKLQELEIKLDEVLKDKEDVEKENVKLNEDLHTLQNKLATMNIKESENKKLAEQLDAARKNNASLQEKCDSLSKALQNLRQEKEALHNEYNAIKQQSISVSNSSSELEKITTELMLKSEQLKKLEMDINILQENNNCMIQEKLKQDKEITDKNNTILNLEKQLQNVADLSKKLQDLEHTIKDKDAQIEAVFVEISNKSKELEAANITRDHLQDKIAALERHQENMTQQLQEHVKELNVKNNKIAVLNNNISRIDDLEKLCAEYKNNIESKEKEIEGLNQHISELNNRIQVSEHTSTSNDDLIKINEEKIALESSLKNLHQELQTKEQTIADFTRKLGVLENTCKEYKLAIDTANTEKTEFINLVNLKHNESIQYHNEIQRLNHVLLEQANEYKKLVEEKEQLAKNNVDKCPNCEALQRILIEKDEIISALNQNASGYEQLKSELNNNKETVKNLTRRCEDLDKNLTIQLDVVKKLSAENLQLSEKEQNSTRELERLRHHLVEMEDNYTQELMTSEQKLNECQSRLQQVEERAKQTSTVYTSNSIRANQEVETLRNQIKLLEKQRDEVQTRLSDAEDTRSRSEAALTNLQIVLEQFQLDKERDIHAATEKIRRQLEEEKQHSLDLQQEIARLHIKLEESIAGLQAATRLGDQVETKTAQINDLKEQVRTLQISVAAAEERYHNAISNQQDRVDKNLVKNLVVNYVVGQNTGNRTQVLRVLSTVLDFNQSECERLGLTAAAPAGSLAAEFVKFLQDESKPRAVVVRPSDVTRKQSMTSQPPDVSRRTSTSSQQPTFEMGHSRNPSTGSHNLLLQNIETATQRSADSETRVIGVTLETGITQTRNNEGAILKNVLKDLG